MKERPEKDSSIIAEITPRSVYIKPQSVFGVLEMRAAFEVGAAFAREHTFMPYEMNHVKAAEEAAARWPD